MREEANVRMTLGELAAPQPGSSTIGPFGSNLVADDYRTEGRPVVFVRDIKAGKFHWTSNVYVSERKARELDAHSVEPGDLLMTKMGFPPCIAAVYPRDSPPGIITADVIRIRLNSSLADARWISHIVNHESTARQVRAITGGVTRPKVTLRDVRMLTVDVPPLSKQQRAAEALATIDAEIAAAAATLAKLGLFKHGLMEDILTGKVRV